ncbi:hypothetical protein AMS68_001312 [Peltaster fructicola]|uniref:CBM1 domain-containing protein n=1 Tax=Peltaster fructicola TaxID=286661 RepID=A0A6H0XMD8_9PEZI|nr:hypothetical protein AMS68_001312 [Peltaster fructicola]
MSRYVSALLLLVGAVAAQEATTTFSPRSLTSTPLITGSAIIVPAPAYPNGFAASVISGDVCTAAYALTCTDAGLCGASGQSFH